MPEAPIITGDIRSLLVPLNDYTLLLPGSVVAEVIPYQDPTPLAASVSAPDWVVGLVTWRGVRVPLVSVEVFGGAAEAPMPGLRARLVVLKGLAGDPQLPFFAIVAQQIPRLQTVSEGMVDGLEDESLEGAPGEPVLVAGEPAVIPELETLEADLLQALYR